MKKVLLFIFICSAVQTYGQKCRVLEDADGGRKMIIYFEATNDYYLCGGPATPRKKIAADEALKGGCDCGGTSGLVEPISVGAEAPNSTTIQFEFDSSILKTSSYQSLDALAADLAANKDKIVKLDGHSSAEGLAAYNYKLAKDRANAIKAYLVSAGIDPKRVEVRSYGDTHPVATNSSEEGRIQNRRVEINIKTAE